MEPIDRMGAVKNAAEFMYKAQGYVGLNLLKKPCPFPEFYLKEILILNGYHASDSSPSQYIKKVLTQSKQNNPVRVELFLECFGPKLVTDPSIGNICMLCAEPIQVNDYTTLLALGPGKDKEMRERAANGQPFKPVVKEVHWACTMGQILEDPDADN